MSATDILLCSFLGLEDGVLLKWDEALSEPFPLGLYAWRRAGPGLNPLYQVIRDSRTANNRWIISVQVDGCTSFSLFPQANDEDLLDDILIPVPVFFGTCDEPQPILNLRVQSYKTIDDALEDWPDVENWVWPDY